MRRQWGVFTISHFNFWIGENITFEVSNYQGQLSADLDSSDHKLFSAGGLIFWHYRVRLGAGAKCTRLLFFGAGSHTDVNHGHNWKNSIDWQAPLVSALQRTSLELNRPQASTHVRNQPSGLLGHIEGGLIVATISKTNGVSSSDRIRKSRQCARLHKSIDYDESWQSYWPARGHLTVPLD